jgi:hypothetical protein
MKTIYFASVCGATLLAVTSLANAQGTGISSNPDQGVTSKQCWDVSSNVIREKNPTDSSSEKTPKTTVGSTASGATGSGASNSTSYTGTASARPAGMPDC